MTHRAPLWIAGTDNPQARARLFCFPFADFNGAEGPSPVHMVGRELGVLLSQ